MKAGLEEGTKEFRCDTCPKFMPNNPIARILGWCSDEGPKPRDVFVAIMGYGATAYDRICEEWAQMPDKELF